MVRSVGQTIQRAFVSEMTGSNAAKPIAASNLKEDQMTDFRELTASCFEATKSKGFVTPTRVNGFLPKFPNTGQPFIANNSDLMLSKIALILSEVAEMDEAYVAADSAHTKEEIADIVLRSLDILGALWSVTPPDIGKLARYYAARKTDHVCQANMPIFFYAKAALILGKAAHFARKGEQELFERSMISCLALCFAFTLTFYGEDLMPIVLDKHEVNKNRPMKHGANVSSM